MNGDALADLAALLRERNAIDSAISRIIGRPALAGHIGEWIAARIFDIELELSATAKGFDGVFRSGPAAGNTVNVKIYGQRAGLLDMNIIHPTDFYLVLSGAAAPAASSRGKERPWGVQAVHLFEATQLHAEQTARGVKIGNESSVRNSQWAAAEIFPRSNSAYPLTDTQRQELAQLDFREAQPVETEVTRTGRDTHL